MLKQPSEVIHKVVILALTPYQIEAISGVDDVVEYVNSFPKFREMLEKGTGCFGRPPIVGVTYAILPLETDKLVKVWEDLQGYKSIISGKVSSIQKRRDLERIQRYITAERITRVQPMPYGTVNTLTDEMKAWYLKNNNPNIYAKFLYDEEGKVDLKKTDIDGWLTEVYRAVFDRLYRIHAGLETNATTKKPCKMKICSNKINCDHLVLANGYNSGGKEKRFCSGKCRNQANSRKSMRKIRGGEKRTVASPQIVVQ
jgi:hypothetical protein